MTAFVLPLAVSTDTDTLTAPLGARPAGTVTASVVSVAELTSTVCSPMRTVLPDGSLMKFFPLRVTLPPGSLCAGSTEYSSGGVFQNRLNAK